MDRFEETYDRATRIASEIVRHEWLRSRGEVTPRPADEEVAAAMRAVTSLFKNVSRFLNDDPMEVTDAEVENVEKYLLARARGAAVAARIRSPG